MFETLIAADHALAQALNAAAGRTVGLDLVLGSFVRLPLLKGAVLMAVFWGLWAAQPRQRPDLVAVLAIASLGVAVARVLAAALPFRDRPLHLLRLDIRPPYGQSPQFLDGWSSFPSDHALFFTALAAGFIIVNRPVGLAVLGYVLAFILLPRIYAGLHYPSDILAGMALGAGMVAVVIKPLTRLVTPLVKKAEARPFLPTAFLFVVTFEAATLYLNTRILLGLIGG
jgi:undecaprenyl-diphosphatase